MKFFFKLKNLDKVFQSILIKKKAKKKFVNRKVIFENLIRKKNFTKKWFLNNFEIFNYYLPQDEKKKFSYLEVGSFEGLSLLNVKYFYKNSQAVAIDLWSKPNFNSEDIGLDLNRAEKNFDRNLNGYDNLEKKKGDSVIEIRKLIQRETSFDFIYIDGSHNGEDVIVDAIESFKILKKHGIMVFDDAMLDIDKNKKYQTYEGVISFINMFKKEIEIMYLRNILIIKKISE